MVPTPNAVTPDVGDVGVVIVPAPLINVHVPVPTTAVLPANVAVVEQMDWSAPALAVVGVADLVIVIWSVDAAQGALVIVHSNTFAPTPNAVTPDVGDVGVVIVPAPLINVQIPVPTTAVFPANVAVVEQTD